MALSNDPIHCDLGPERCFGCKARTWRFNPGSLGVSYRGGRDMFHDHTVGEVIRENLALAKANGREVDVKSGPAQAPINSLGLG